MWKHLGAKKGIPFISFQGEKKQTAVFTLTWVDLSL